MMQQYWIDSVKAGLKGQRESSMSTATCSCGGVLNIIVIDGVKHLKCSKCSAQVKY